MFGGPKVLAPADFEQQINNQYGAQAKAILDAHPHANETEAARAARHVRNESTFFWNAWAWERQQSSHGKGKVYGYFYNNHAPEAEGSGHGSDVPFAFQTLAGRKGVTEADLKLSDMISSYYVNFAITGDPNGKGLPQWPAFTNANQSVMVFDAAPSARPYPMLDKVKLYDAYYNIKGK